MWFPRWSILVEKYFNFCQKLPIQTAHHIFLESRHLEVTKNLYYVLSSRRSQIPIFLGSTSWTKNFIPKTRHSLCTALFLTLTTNSIKSHKMEAESKSASEHSKILFFINTKIISIKEVNLSTKGHRHILKSQSTNEKLLKKTPLKQYWGTLLKKNVKHLQNIELNLLPLLEHK